MFLSANPHNIEIFRAIAEREVIRSQIVEITWDDVCLKDEPGPRRSGHPASPNYDTDFDE